ncbi:hypothetical protein BT96DRAFT_1010979 [Gymnopus androsaceus JB14]|uniref:Uncharacterized protein n=1 Tax=Gymnopus androsaceus JB14 TaxID=1447944 RepID=A0A6A4G9X5_9AGAR|nr:hypothetical protein BT96DRAFT_1010979 [Gymnopus androsaceus JB14]
MDIERQLSRGTISFKTCSRYMASYDGNSDDVKAAVHSWLLMEILDGIGTPLFRIVVPYVRSLPIF